MPKVLKSSVKKNSGKIIYFLNINFPFLFSFCYEDNKEQTLCFSNNQAVRRFYKVYYSNQNVMIASASRSFVPEYLRSRVEL